MSRCYQPQIQDVHIQNTAVKLSPSSQKDMLVSSRQKSISCRTCLKPLDFWWLCNQFLSFCLGQDWNPCSFNASADTAGELHRQYCGCGPSQPSPDTSPALPGANSNTTDGFVLGLCWACLSSVHEWAKSSTRSPEVTSALHTLVCTHYSQPPKSECPNYTLSWCLPLSIYASQGQKLSQCHLTTPDQGQIQMSNLIIGCMSHVSRF